MVSEHSLADASRGHLEVCHICHRQSWHQHTVAVHKLMEGVTNWVACPTNPGRWIKSLAFTPSHPHSFTSTLHTTHPHPPTCPNAFTLSHPHPPIGIPSHSHLTPSPTHMHPHPSTCPNAFTLSHPHILTPSPTHKHPLTPSPDGLHHARVPELSCTELTVKHKSLLALVRFDTAHKERLALAEGVHERVKGLLELHSQSGRLLACLNSLGRERERERGG